MRQVSSNPISSRFTSNQRVQVWYAFLLIIVALFIVRLFYLQVIQHDYYRKQALSGQLKQYNIPAVRGIISAHDGSNVVPIVLNEKLYTLFADPTFITKPDEYGAKLSAITKGPASEYADKMRTKDTRYVILAKKLSRDQQKAIDKLQLKGIGTREESYRTYPQGSLAAQVLGFVNDEGQGRYGLEEDLNKDLGGKPGLLKAITDASGVPLVANRDNIDISPQAGEDVTLTIDVAMQRQLEDILKQGLDKAKSKSGSALIIDPNNGAIKAVANYPTFSPAEYYKQEDIKAFSNDAFSSPLEPGSVMKPFTAAAALQQGVVSTSTSYFDPSFFKIDGHTVTNIEEDGGPGVRTVRDILQLSLNTGAVWLLQQMGGGDINKQARTTWHEYMTSHYRFGQNTGVEGYEVAGVIPDPTVGDGLNIRYANSAFGQGMTVTPLQLGAALSAVINGGTYYKPHVVESTTTNGKTEVNKPQILRANVVSGQVSQTVQDLMAYVVDKNNPSAKRAGYVVGGKTGTAEIAKPGGGYYEDLYNGMYIGFVTGNKPAYVIIVRVNEPHIAGYAGAQAAAPIFSSITNMLFDTAEITPKTP